MAFWSGKKNKVEDSAEQSKSEQSWTLHNNVNEKASSAATNVEEIDEQQGFASNKIACKREKVVPAGLTLTGHVSFDSPVKIEGQINGELFSASTVIVDLTGEISGTLEANVFDVYGKVNGELRARNKIILRNGAEVVAKVISPKLEIEEGAYLEGECQI